MWEGRVLEINVTATEGAALGAVAETRAVPGKGLEGDRAHATAERTGKPASPEEEVTLIESEALEGLARDYGITLSGAESRRNLLTAGVPLNHLVSHEFRVGECTLRGVELCEPCGHLEKLTKKGVMKGLLHRGGLRATIVKGGLIRAGDPITAG